MDEDCLYHLDLGTKTHNLPAMFGDVKVKVILTFGKIIMFFLLFLIFPNKFYLFNWWNVRGPDRNQRHTLVL